MAVPGDGGVAASDSSVLILSSGVSGHSRDTNTSSLLTISSVFSAKPLKTYVDRLEGQGFTREFLASERGNATLVKLWGSTILFCWQMRRRGWPLMGRIMVPQSYGQGGVRPWVVIRCINSHNIIRIVHETHETSENDVIRDIPISATRNRNSSLIAKSHYSITQAKPGKRQSRPVRGSCLVILYGR